MTDTPPAADAASLASTVQTDTPPPPAPKTLSELAAQKAAARQVAGSNAPVSGPDPVAQTTKVAARYSTEDALASLGAALLTGGPVKDGKIFMEWLKDYSATQE